MATRIIENRGGKVSKHQNVIVQKNLYNISKLFRLPSNNSDKLKAKLYKEGWVSKADWCKHTGFKDSAWCMYVKKAVSSGAIERGKFLTDRSASGIQLESWIRPKLCTPEKQ